MSSSDSRLALVVPAVVFAGALAIALLTRYDAPASAVALIALAYFVTTLRSRPRAPKRSKKNAPVLVMMPRGDDEMFSVLDSLGIPADGSGGNAKAAIYRGYKLLTSGRSAEGVSALRDLARTLEPANDPEMRRVAAVAHYLIGKAHEASGDRAAAMAEFSVCLRLEPDYLLTRSGLDTVHPTEH
jgi:hypothetical protein